MRLSFYLFKKYLNNYTPWSLFIIDVQDIYILEASILYLFYMFAYKINRTLGSNLFYMIHKNIL